MEEQQVPLIVVLTFLEWLRNHVRDFGVDYEKDKETFLVFFNGRPIGWGYKNRKFKI